MYAKKPLTYRGNIPVFSRQNEYTDNYEKISVDHLKSIENGGTNPFIPESLWRQSEQSTIDLVKKYSRRGEAILDVGVGLGRILSFFPELRKYGMDISFPYLKAAQKNDIEVCYAMIEDMPYKKEMFDIVVCTDVLEHVFDLNLCVSRVLSVLKKDGFLIVRVPYREDLSGYVGADSPYEYVHIRNFDEYSLCLLFEKVFHCEMVETTDAGYIFADNRIKGKELFSPEELSFLASWLSKLERISLSLYWEIIRKLNISVEINAVIKKEVTQRKDVYRGSLVNGKPGFSDQAEESVIRSPSIRNTILSLESELMAQRQKNSFMEGKTIEVTTGLKRISEFDSLRDDFDSLKLEMDNLRLERNELQEKLDMMSKKLGDFDRVKSEMESLRVERNEQEKKLDMITKRLKRWHLLWLIGNSNH
jgi:SAM-dependent methyltransferase